MVLLLNDGVVNKVNGKLVQVNGKLVQVVNGKVNNPVVDNGKLELVNPMVNGKLAVLPKAVNGKLVLLKVANGKVNPLDNGKLVLLKVDGLVKVNPDGKLLVLDPINTTVLVTVNDMKLPQKSKLNIVASLPSMMQLVVSSMMARLPGTMLPPLLVPPVLLHMVNNPT